MTHPVICVLLVASGAAWESGAVGVLGSSPGVVLLKRCVDVDDLMAAATTGQAQAAVVALDAPGLDAAATDHLRRHGVRVVAVSGGDQDEGAARMRASRVGVTALLGEDRVGELGDVLVAAGADEPVTAEALAPGPGASEVAAPAPAPGRVIAVWGPRGAPGRTLLATTLAAELAHRGVRTMLVDADPGGGAVAQVLGVMDEVSGLLAAARLAGTGDLAARLATVQRAVAPGLSVVTGLPRADRWTEVRPGALEHLLEVAREQAVVVVDTGSDLDDDGGALGRPGRNQMTLGALEVADEVVVVGTADPVGLSRLARGLVEVRETLAGAPVRVVVNRMRASLGWKESEVATMVEGFARLSGLHFVPEDRAGVDRALVAGRSLRESGEEPVVRAVSDLVDVMAPYTASGVPRSRGAGRLRRRTGAAARRR
ncbi:hypothetical protein [uncultured Nocardioides sp.]|uniref:AAA family ATPase n=1 Tax=uncultured Nocardioides sp. TaxID=198441 RepID=UPI0026300F0C|nr:hypothetical protein [uncultured Nocardioides sp.]